MEMCQCCMMVLLDYINSEEWRPLSFSWSIWWLFHNSCFGSKDGPFRDWGWILFSYLLGKLGAVSAFQHMLCLHLLERNGEVSRIWAAGSQMHKGDNQNSSVKPQLIILVPKCIFSLEMADIWEKNEGFADALACHISTFCWISSPPTLTATTRSGVPLSCGFIYPGAEARNTHGTWPLWGL